MLTFDDLAREVEQSGLFDADWYVKTFPDARLVDVTPIQHFVRFGLLLQRDPGPRFDTRHYVEVNPDVVAAGMDPLLHYIRHGEAEGREPLTLAMGFARLSAGRCSVLVDAAPPPQGTAARTGHASTLAFEMTSARRPLIVNCGSGASFGETWRRAGRATPSHSTLCVDGVSSSRFAREHDGDAPAGLPAADLLAETPRDVRVQAGAAGAARSLLTGHDGWVATHGLTHMRKLVLARDGREIAGEDTLGAMTEQHRRRFERVVAEGALRGIAFRIRFHLHPDVEPSIDDDPDLNGGHGVTLALRSGEVWRFRHDGTAVLSVEPSVYLEPGRLKPRATRQLVLSGRVLDYACQIGWTLGKAQDTPQGIRDLARGDDDDMAFD